MADPIPSRPSLVIDARVVDSSGLGRYFRNVVSGIIATGRFDITLLGDARRLAFHPWAAQTRVVEFPYRIYSIGEQIGFLRTIPSCDLFWSPHYNVPLFPIRSRRRVVTIHDVLHLALVKQWSLIRRLFVVWSLNYGVFASDAVITVSEYSRRQIEQLVRARPRRIQVIHNGIAADFGAGQVRSADAPPYFLYVGNVKPHKNLKTALLAFRQFVATQPEYRFYIAGQQDGFLTGDPEIDAIVATFAPGAVQLLGHLSDEELKPLYRNARAFVFPSLHEGFGLPILEAMAFDTPVIASNTTSIPEVGGDAIEYFDPTQAPSILEAMRRVTAPGYQIDRAKYAAQRNKFALERCVAQHLELLLSLCPPRVSAVS